MGAKRPITVTDVYIEHGQEEDCVVILFQDLSRPQCLFGFSMPAYEIEAEHGKLDAPVGWTNDPALVWADMIAAYLAEYVGAADMGLPEECSTTSITWIP